MNKLHELSNEELSQKIDQQVDLIYQTSQTGEFSAKHIDDFDLLAREFFAYSYSISSPKESTF